jgi:hypothetical protein
VGSIPCEPTVCENTLAFGGVVTTGEGVCNDAGTLAVPRRCWRGVEAEVDLDASEVQVTGRRMDVELTRSVSIDGGIVLLADAPRG